MHFMTVKNSRTRSGFLNYSYFKNSVFTAVIFPLARFSLFFLGEYITYSLTVLFTGGKVGGGFDCNRGGAETIGQLHDDVILLQLPESFSLLFSCAN